MGDPQRLLMLTGNGESDDLERELLASIQEVDPPAEAKGAAWARLSAQIGAVALVSATAHSAAATAGATQATVGSSAASAAAVPAKAALGTTGLATLALKTLGAKLAVALAAAALAAGAGALWVHAQGQPSSVPARTSVAAPVAAPMLVGAANSAPVAALPAEAPLVDHTPSPALSPEPVNARRVSDERRHDRLGAESALLTQARGELRTGDARAAQQSLNRLQARFPHGVLGQEREVLAIEVLAARGNAAAAEKRARAFIAAYPKSPHSATLKRFVAAP